MRGEGKKKRASKGREWGGGGGGGALHFGAGGAQGSVFRLSRGHPWPEGLLVPRGLKGCSLPQAVNAASVSGGAPWGGFPGLEVPCAPRSAAGLGARPVRAVPGQRQRPQGGKKWGNGATENKPFGWASRETNKQTKKRGGWKRSPRGGQEERSVSSGLLGKRSAPPKKQPKFYYGHCSVPLPKCLQKTFWLLMRSRYRSLNAVWEVTLLVFVCLFEEQ